MSVTTEGTAVYSKLERAGQIAVLYSPGYGAGWWTWNRDHEGLIFDAEIVNAVLAGDRNRAVQIAETKYPGIYAGGGEDLEVYWVNKGVRFMIDEYDGSEGVTILDPDFGHIA